jgi:hypothetical protein
MLIGGVLSAAWVAVGFLIVLICVSLDACHEVPTKTHT